MDRREMYKKVIELYGEDLQLNMLIEECSELILIISKFLRSRMLSDINPKEAKYIEMEEIIDEIADLNGPYNLKNSSRIEAKYIIRGKHWRFLELI